MSTGTKSAALEAAERDVVHELRQTQTVSRQFDKRYERHSADMVAKNVINLEKTKVKLNEALDRLIQLDPREYPDRPTAIRKLVATIIS